MCERMGPNDAIRIIGAQRYSKYEGYGETFKFKAMPNEKLVKR